jgi:Tol biopolymer transport system component/predicted Ser/Thr protein kinase
MSLTPGTRLGPYVVMHKVGAGGMGEVYRATDTKLNRDAALKILPEIFTADPDRRSRFTREAQVLASLNHPNIAGIYGFDDASGTAALAMEFVDGEDLSAIIARGAIPLRDVLSIARQVADALEAAHEQGIVHRDLKPQNIKVKADGAVKVLDFGLAKAFDPLASSSGEAMNSPTMTVRATQIGMIIGTAAYMSPEQARGKAVDRRADIWAFGVVVYEMLTGRRAFEGEEISDVLAAVLRQDIDWSVLPAATPPPLRRLLERCLDRDSRQRLRDIGEARVEIAKIESGAPDVSGIRGAAALTIAETTPWKRSLPVVFGLALAAAAAVAGWTLRPAPPPLTAVTRFSFTLSEGQQFTNTGRQVLSIAPDGSQFVYVANNRLYLKPMAEMSSLLIQGTEIAQGVMNPVFSPDGRSIAFYSSADRTLKRIAVSGGAAVTIGAIDPPYGISWEMDNEILIGQGAKGIVRVSANGGKPETIIAVDDAEQAHGPRMLPGGDSVLFTLALTSNAAAGTVGPERWNKAHIVAQSLRSGKRRVLIEGGSDARYVASGHLVYALSGTILAVPFDADALTVTGGPVPVIEDVVNANSATGTSQFSISQNGSLVFVPGGSEFSLQQLTWFDRAGKAVGTTGSPGGFAGINVSSDGKRFAVHRHEGGGGDIWVYETPTGAPMRLTFDPSQDNGMPVWSPDGRRIVFQSLRNGKWGLYEKNSDGTGAEDLLLESELVKTPMAWSPDGQSIAYGVLDPKNLSDLWVLRLDGDRKPSALLVSRFGENFSQVSPNGKWLAYISTESGTPHVYVKSFPRGDGKWQVSTADYGSFPRWRGDGKELFYLTGVDRGKMMSVEVNGSGSSFVAATPAELFAPGLYGAVTPGHRGNFFPYAVSPDGQRFLMPQPMSASKPSASPSINVILNWTSLLKK